MDEGELDLLMSNSDMSTSFDEFLKNTTTTTCTHTHTCNPPGPTASSHTHTCYHTHTQVFTASEGEREEEEMKKTRKPLGNREAVRKYREKKKAHAAHLEEEVKKLRLVNQQLVKRLQGQAALEAEVIRLRSLLVGIRGKIDGELGVYPFQKPCNGVGLVIECNAATPAIVDCQFNVNGNLRQISDATRSFDT